MFPRYYTEEVTVDIRDPESMIWKKQTHKHISYSISCVFPGIIVASDKSFYII